MKMSHTILGVAFATFSLTFATHSSFAQSYSQTRDIIESTLSGNNTGQEAVRLTFLVVNKDGSPQMERAAHFPFYTGESFRAKIVSSHSGTLQLTNISPAGKVTTFRTISVQAGIPAYYPPETGAVLRFANSTGNETLRVAFTPNTFNLPTTPTNSTPPQQPSQYPSGGYIQTPQVQYPPSVPPAQQTQQPVAQPYPQYNPAVPSSQPPVTQIPSAPTPLPNRPSDYFSDVQGKAYAYAKDIQEVVLETQQATYLTRPAGSGVLQFDVVVQHRNQ